MKLFSTAARAAAVAPVLSAASVITNDAVAAEEEEEKLRSAFLFDLVFEKGTSQRHRQSFRRRHPG